MATTIKPVRKVSSWTGALRRTAADPTVKSEFKLALSGLSRAAKRARRVGTENALRDQRLAGHLREASTHAARAFTAARSPRAQHSILARAVVTAGASALSGAAYSRWRAHARSQTA